jgi:hypothetical protein
LIDILIQLKTINYWRRFKLAHRVMSERRSMMTSEAFENRGYPVGLITVIDSFGGRGLLLAPEANEQERPPMLQQRRKTQTKGPSLWA